MDGLLVVDKPAGPTSHDVVARVRRVTGERRVGHTGTLDPAASGVLPLVLGRATRLARFLSRSDKTYEAVIELGVDTDTHDAEGRAIGAAHAGPLPGRDAIDRALDAFRGTFMQTPPVFSAKKIAGVRSYARARAGSGPGPRQPALTAVPVVVSDLELLAGEGTRIDLRVTCSAGFYVRALAHDLGRVLGVGAHLVALRRTRSGGLTLADAVPLETIERDPAAAARALVPLRGMLPEMSAIRLTDEGSRRARHGRDLGPADLLDPPGSGTFVPPVRLLDAAGDLVGLAEAGASPGLLHPAVVLV